jgi:hypothetical protein
MPESPKKKLGRPRKYFNESGKDGAPKLSLRIDPELYSYIHGRPEGPRQFLETLIKIEMAKDVDFHQVKT